KLTRSDIIGLQAKLERRITDVRTFVGYAIQKSRNREELVGKGGLKPLTVQSSIIDFFEAENVVANNEDALIRTDVTNFWGAYESNASVFGISSSKLISNLFTIW